MQLVWHPACQTIHEMKQFHLHDVRLVWQPKTRHKFSPTTDTNQKFWYHLCYIPRALTIL